MTIPPPPRAGKLAAALLATAVGGCALPPLPVCAPGPDGPVVWLTDYGWHTEVALRVADLAGPLAALRPRFPGADVLSFGYGQRRFVLARAGDPTAWLLGPLPGDGVVQVTGLRGAPGSDGDQRAVTLPVAAEGIAGLSDFLWASLAKDAAGTPIPATPEPLRGRLFFDSPQRYTLGFTCNTWAAEALRRAGVPVSERGVVFARALLGQLGSFGGGCRA